MYSRPLCNWFIFSFQSELTTVTSVRTFRLKFRIDGGEKSNTLWIINLSRKTRVAVIRLIEKDHVSCCRGHFDSITLFSRQAVCLKTASSRSPLNSDHTLTYYGCLRFPPTFIHNFLPSVCLVMRPLAGWHRRTAGAVSCCSGCSKRSLKKRIIVCAAGRGSRILGEPLSIKCRVTLAVLDNGVWLVHTAALAMKPDPRRWMEVTKGGRGDVGATERVRCSGYPLSLRRGKEKHSSS